MVYLPRRTSERRQRITGVGGQEHTLIFLETPHRLVEALEDLYAILGDRPVAVGRELTKLHEEMYRGRLADALAFFQANAPRGEFTLVVGGKTPGDAGPWEEERLMEAARIGLAEGTPISQLAAELEARSGWQRREVYRKILDWKNTGDGE
jgi:16S rRNA (cytidine1402-2'-O)-methyltransferase